MIEPYVNTIFNWIKTHPYYSGAMTAIFLFIVGSIINCIKWINKMIKERLEKIEKFDIKAYGSYISDKDKSLFSLNADIYNNGDSTIDIIDIKIELKDINLFCFLEGDIITAADNDHKTINTEALNFSNKYDQVKMPNIRPFHITLTSDKNYIKIVNTYLSTKQPINSEYVNAYIEVITKYSTKKHGFLTRALNKRYYKNISNFKFLENKRLKRYEGFEIPLIEENDLKQLAK